MTYHRHNWKIIFVIFLAISEKQKEESERDTAKLKALQVFAINSIEVLPSC